MPALVLRHGPTAKNAEAGVSPDCLRGWSDLPLTPEGRDQVAETAFRLADLPVTRIYTTDLQRGVETAEPLSEQTKAPISRHVELRPWHYGQWTGMPTDQALPLLDNLVNHPTVPAPGGESFLQFLTRFLPFVLPLLRQPTLSAVVTHGRNVKALEAYLANHGHGLNMQVWSSAPLIPPAGVLYATPTGMRPLFEESDHG